MLLRAGKIDVGVGRLRGVRERLGDVTERSWVEDVHGRCGLSSFYAGARDVPCMFKDSRFCLDDGGSPCGGRPETGERDLFGRSGALHHFFWDGGRKKRKKEDGERTSYIERKREKGRDPAHNRGLYKHESEKNGVEAGTVLVSSSHVRDPAASLRFTGRPGAWCERGPGFILLKGYRD